MKKSVLSLAGLLAAAAFAPEASAIPAFARQVGMACSACHAQHFPVLNGFGRAFKASGYTMMGAQPQIEGEHLSIPNTLNASMLFKLRHVKDNNSIANAGAAEKGPIAGAGDTARTTTSDGQWQFGDEFSLFFGGRVSENVGFIFEGNVVSGGQLMAGFRMPFVFDVGGAKLSVVPFSTDAMGPQLGYEQSSSGVLRSNRWAESRREISAVQYNADRNCTAGNKAFSGGTTPAADVGGGDCGAATGFAFAAQNDFGYIAFTKWSPSFLPGGNGQGYASTKFGNNYFRIAATPTMGDWAMQIGGGRMSGSSWSNVAATTGVGTEVASDQTFFDFQAQGEVAGKELGIYVQHAKAPKGTATKKNVYNSETAATSGDRKAWTVGADYSVIPHALSLGLAYRKAENGKAATANGDDATTLTAVYDLAQNIALHLNYTHYSGNAHLNGVETNQTLLLLEGAW
ncbi:MAG: hypothetical protein FD134_57 [Gallionellaceae bacterium]|nr:MAG: hypothetical protein FD134_57 [Gallionellaceae bacterium]